MILSPECPDDEDLEDEKLFKHFIPVVKVPGDLSRGD